MKRGSAPSALPRETMQMGLNRRQGGNRHRDRRGIDTPGRLLIQTWGDIDGVDLHRVAVRLCVQGVVDATSGIPEWDLDASSDREISAELRIA